MGRIESLQEQVRALSGDELAQFRAWFLDRDWDDWDTQLEDDVRAGRLDAIANQALRDHTAGKSTPL
jgi:hypothetical protein